MSLLGNAQEYLHMTQMGSAALAKLIHELRSSKTEKKFKRHKELKLKEVYEYKYECCLEVEKRLKDLIILIGGFVKKWREMEGELNK